MDHGGRGEKGESPQYSATQRQRYRAGSVSALRRGGRSLCANQGGTADDPTSVLVFSRTDVFCERKPRDSRVVGKSLSGEKDKKTPNVLD